MHKLTATTPAAVVRRPVEGSSVRAAARVTATAKATEVVHQIPAVAPGVADQVWTVEEVLGLMTPTAGIE